MAEKSFGKVLPYPNGEIFNPDLLGRWETCWLIQKSPYSFKSQVGYWFISDKLSIDPLI